MSEPIKIVVTAQTAEAAAALQQFVNQTGGGLQQVAKHAGHAAEGMGQSRLAMMELGHVARSTAESLAFGMNPLRILALESPRIAQSMTMLGIPLKAMAPYALAAAAAAGVFALEWYAVVGRLGDSTKALEDNIKQLDKIPALLEKIQTYSKAGLLSTAAAQEAADFLNGRKKLFQDLAGAYHPQKADGSAPTETLVETGVVQAGMVAMATEARLVTRPMKQVTDQSKLNDYVAQNFTPPASEEQAKAAAKLKELHAQVLEQTQSETAAIQEKYRKEIESIRLVREQSGRLIGPHTYDQANADIAALKQKEANEIAAVQQKARDERVKQQAQSATQIRTDGAKQAAADLKKVEDQITADQDKAGSQRGALARQEYKLRVDAAERAYFAGEIAEDEYTHRIQDAAHKRAEAEKQYNAELEHQVQLKHSLAQAEAEAKLHQIAGNPFLTTDQKREQSVPVIGDLIASNAASLADQQGIAARSTDEAARLEAMQRIVELQSKQVELQQQLNEAQNANNFGYQMSEMVTRLQSINTLAQQTAATFEGVYTTSLNSVTSALTGVVMGTRTWRQALASIYNAIVTEIVQSFIHMAVQWALQHTLMAAASKLFQAQDVAGHAAATGAKVATHAVGESQMTVSTMLGSVARQAWHLAETVFHGIMVALRVAAHEAGELASTVITAAQTALRAMYHAIVAAIAAMESEASVPYVGVVLGIAAAGAIMAAAVGLMGGFAEGGYTGDGGKYDIAGVVHRGEFVVPAHAVSRIGLGNLEAMRSGSRSSTAASPAGSPAAHSSSPSIYAFTDPRQMADHLERNSDHEKWVVDVMRRNIHKFRS